MLLVLRQSWAIVALIINLEILSAEALWQDKAWVRKYPCGQVSQGPPLLESTPFWIDSFRGSWDTTKDLKKLELDVLAVHNGSLISCEEIDIFSLEKALEFQVLGYSVGQLEHLSSNCPLSVTQSLSP
jgi:hypothetical protein